MPEPRLQQLHWPMAGVVRRYAFAYSPPYSCPDSLNVRPDSVQENSDTSEAMRGRERGGSRPGLAKMFDEQLGGGGETTAAIDFDATAAEVKAALEAMAAIAVGDVVVSGDPGGPWLVEFTGSYERLDVPSIIGSGASLTGGGEIDVELVEQNYQFPSQAPDDPITYDYYKVTLTSAPTGGTFTLTVNGETTGGIPFITGNNGSIDADDVRSKISLLPSIPSGGAITVSVFEEGVPGTLTKPVVIHLWFRIYDGDPASYQDNITLTADGANLTGSKGTVTVETTQEASGTQNEQQTITLGEEVTGGTFTLSWGVQRQVNMLNTVTWISASGSLQTRLAAISGGKLSMRAEGIPSKLVGTDGGTFNPDVLIHSAMRNQILYIADWAYDQTLSSSTYFPKSYNPSTDTIAALTATTGTVPKGCNCIGVWRDRLVLGGGTTTPHNLHMSRQGDPLDWNYGADSDDQGRAVSLTLADAGQVGDVITAISPHADNCLIVGCITSLWILLGDPAAGGQLNNLSQQLGVIDSGAWCVTPENLFIFLSQDGIYMMPAGCDVSRYPQSVSRERMPEEMLGTDRTLTNVAMAYDTLRRGVHIFLTPRTPGSTGSQHWWFDWEGKSFWPVRLGNSDFEPFAIHQRQNFYSRQHSGVALGCRDGYIRRFREDASKDDGYRFDTEVWLGPFGDPEMLVDTLLVRLRAILGSQSQAVKWYVHRGQTPEEAFDSEPVFGSTWLAGVGNWKYPRVRGGSLYLRLIGTPPWAWEGGSMVLRSCGRHRAG